MNGRLIVVEGLDRSGKTTQCSKLAALLRESGREVVEMKFPNRETPTGKIINEYLTNNKLNLNDQAIHLLFSANRWEQVPYIQAALNRGAYLIVDRYLYSGVAFSSAKGLDFNWCLQPDIGLPTPDLVLFLDISAESASARGGYGSERYEKVDLQTRVRHEFQKLEKTSASKWVWIDAGNELETVHTAIAAAVRMLK